MSAKPIPLREQPEYKAAISKVVEINRTISENSARLERARAELFETQTRAANSPGALDRAMEIVTGKTAPNRFITESLAAEVQRLEVEQRELAAGLAAANTEAEAVATRLAREMGVKARAKHAETVRRILECIKALDEANRKEEGVREELERLGYHSHGLPNQEFMAPGRIDDHFGSPAYYYVREANEYLIRV